MIDRRFFLAASAAAFAAGCRGNVSRATPPEPARKVAPDRFEAIRASLGPGARIGVAAIDTRDGSQLVHDPLGRYAMASTFKLPLAAAILEAADEGRLRLADEIEFEAGEPLPHSTVVTENLAAGRLSIEALAAAIVRVSDNSAANLLLRRLGGPEAFTRFARAHGDPVTRLDRYETELNSNHPGDPRDTTSPATMAALVGDLVLGDALSRGSRQRLVQWLTTAVPGADRLRAGLPEHWRFGHKTGTGANGAVNDVGIAWPPGRPPIVIASFQDGGTAELPARAAAHAAVAGLVAETFA
ncbi:MAG TPA: class A beta-lactamase [Allosphingosinicella sp.]|nr:class A beta-lactamase [Allosphingosinicella sp.]